MNISNGNNNYDSILGVDDMARPVTRDHLDKAGTAIAKLRLLASIEGPVRHHLCDILTALEGSTLVADKYKKRCDSLSNALLDIVGAEFRMLVEDKLSDRLDDFITSDNIEEHILDSISSNRRVRAEIEATVGNNIDTGAIVDEVRSEVERNLDDRIEGAINDFDFDTHISDAVTNILDDHDFGDMLDDHTRDIDEKIVKRLVDEIGDDPLHPLVNAIAAVLAARLTK